MNNVSLELYRTFLMLGKTKNITSAAKLLYVSQPSVSFALKTLEEQLGTTLCTRGKKGVTLTAEGQVLFDELCPAFEHIETAERKLSSLLRLDSGVVSISAGD
ncbi:MAG: LysR family transcriptional regulator, partial [Oscillospiraceae bacterium]|nr:LysR family transcriptional regulator [Oscillospiraceae bacterium]